MDYVIVIEPEGLAMVKPAQQTIAELVSTYGLSLIHSSRLNWRKTAIPNLLS